MQRVHIGIAGEPPYRPGSLSRDVDRGYAAFMKRRGLLPPKKTLRGIALKAHERRRLK